MRIVDVRDEGAAVHMAHAHAALTGGVGIAMVTAGPGVTNCVTAMANAQLERVPVLLIGGCAPRAQDDLGPLQGIAHVEIMRPVTRSSRTLRVADNVLRDLDKAYAAAAGDGGPPGPAYVEIPTDVLRETVPPKLVLPEWLATKPPRRIPPDADDVGLAAEIIGQAKRPLVLTGRGALAASPELVRFLDRTGAVYLDTQESRNLVPAGHASVVGAMRGRAMQEADLAIVVGRKLDYQTGYGSPAVLPHARFIRIARQLGGAAGEPPRRGRAVRASGARARGAGRRGAGTVAAARHRVDRRPCATSTCAGPRSTPTRSAARRPARTATCIRTGSSRR